MVATRAAPAAAEAPAAVYRLLAELLRAPVSANWLRCLPAPSEETVGSWLTEAHDLTLGVGDAGRQLQLFWAMRNQLAAQPELALDTDFGAFVLQHLRMLRAGQHTLGHIVQAYRQHELYEPFTSVIELSSDEFNEPLRTANTHLV